MGNDSYIVLNYSIDNQISSVVVFFEECDTWNELKSQYTWCVDMYTEKYGTPLFETQSFSSYKNDKNGLAMSAVKDNECDYRTIWEVPNGMIYINISSNASVVILYSDDFSRKNNRESIIDEI